MDTGPSLGAKSLEKRALAPVVLGKSLIFALLLVAFHIVEETIRASFEGQPLSAAVDGSLASVLAYAAIFFVVLIPFYAFQEAARVLGGDALWDLFFRRRVNRIRLVEDQAIEP